MKLFGALLFIFVLLSNFALGADYYLLTHTLEFSNSASLAGSVSLKPGKQVTLMKKISESKGIVKVQMIQENGSLSDRVLFVSAKWFAAGTDKKVQYFEIDPNKEVAKLNKVNSDFCITTNFIPTSENKTLEVVLKKTEVKKLDVSPKNPCDVLETNSKDVSLYMSCHKAILAKINYKKTDSSYEALSKLYTLTPAEQKYMAIVLTMFAEASILRPQFEHMAAVLKVIQNRLRVARGKDPNATELDVVLQNAQFSSFDNEDPNWRRALSSKLSDYKTAIDVYIKRNEIRVLTDQSQGSEEKVYHYVTEVLNKRAEPRHWFYNKPTINVIVDSNQLSQTRSHVFFKNIPWKFVNHNKYKSYAKQEGLIQ